MDPDKLTHRTNEALTASQDLAMGLDMHRSHLSHGQSMLYGQQVKAKMEQQVVPSCLVNFDLELFIIVRFKESSGRFPAQSVIRSSNIVVLVLHRLLVLFRTSQSRQHDKSESDSYYLSD
ncbi:hypothetical protein Tco_0832835 [Tanacetum coccineum]